MASKNNISKLHQALHEEYVMPNRIGELADEVEAEKYELERYIESNGEYMEDITNGKTYLVQFLQGLSELVGVGYVMCAPVREDGTYGAFYVKPKNSFRKKISNQLPNNQQTTRHIKPNLYQQMQREGDI